MAEGFRELPVEQLLRWRLAQAEAAAPSAPRAAQLLEMARPWSACNEYWPEAALARELAKSCELLKVTDRMPFRLILITHNVWKDVVIDETQTKPPKPE
jgi:hypothetical protein